MNSKIYRNIMVATDGSEFVRRAVAAAIEIAKLSEAKLSQAKLCAVYVIANDEFSITYPKDT